MNLYFTYNGTVSSEYPDEFNTIVFKTNPVKYTLQLTLHNGVDTLSLSSLKNTSIYLCDKFNNLHKLQLSNDNTPSGISFYVDLPETNKIKSLIVVSHLDADTIRQEFLDIQFKFVNTLKRELRVLKDITPISEPNFLVEKSKVTMQTWSAAFKKDISVYTKVVEPYYKVINNFYTKTNDLLKKNLDGYSTYNISERPLKITSESTQYLQYNNVNNSNYKTLALDGEQTNSLVVSYYSPTLTFKPLTYSKAYKLYIKKATKNSQSIVYLKGVDSFGNIVTESVNLYNSLYKETINLYTQLLWVTSEETLEISTYVDCCKVHNYLSPLVTPTPVFIDKTYNFNYYQPNYILERSTEGTHSVLSVKNDFNNTTKYSFNFSTQSVESLYIDESLNVYWTSGGYLHASNLSLDFSTKITSTGDNVNSYIYTSEEACLGDWIDVYIDIDRLYRDTQLSHIVFTVVHNGTQYYLNTETGLLQNDKYLINCETVKDVTKLTVRVTDAFPYIFKLIGTNTCYSVTIAPYILTPKVSIPVPIEQSISIINSDVVLVDSATPMVEPLFEDKTSLIFTWDFQDDLDTVLEINGYKIGFNIAEIDSTFVSRVIGDGFTSAEVYLLDLVKLKQTFFKNSDVVIKVRSNWSTCGNVISDRSNATLTILTPIAQQQMTLSPKDTDKYEYEISIESNGTINVTQLTGY